MKAKDSGRVGGAAISKRLRFQVLERDGFRCRYCGVTAEAAGEALQIDHILPLARGGRTVMGNLAVACRLLLGVRQRILSSQIRFFMMCPCSPG